MLGEGSGWDLRIRPAASAASGNLGTWKSRNLETWGPGNPEIWRSGDLEIQKCWVQKIKKSNFKMQIRSAKNVGKVWIRRKKSSWPHLGPSEAIFSMDWKNVKNAKKMPISLGGPMGPYSPGVGPCCYPPEVGQEVVGQSSGCSAAGSTGTMRRLAAAMVEADGTAVSSLLVWHRL